LIRAIHNSGEGEIEFLLAYERGIGLKDPGMFWQLSAVACGLRCPRHHRAERIFGGPGGGAQELIGHWGLSMLSAMVHMTNAVHSSARSQCTRLHFCGSWSAVCTGVHAGSALQCTSAVDSSAHWQCTRALANLQSCCIPQAPPCLWVHVIRNADHLRHPPED
jgi:hypothetical protein